MNKYYPVIARAVERLDESTGETRGAVYERARKAVALLRANQPALLDADMTRECLALEEAILQVEAEAACCLGSEMGAEARSPASAVSISYDDKVQSRDDGQSVSLDRDDRPQPLSSRQAPTFFSASNERDSVDIQAVEIGGAYGADHYHDEAPSSRWRGGFLFVMVALALAVLAGTFAYRGMFGGDMFAATLPRILKGGTGPDNLVPNDSTRRSNSSQTYTISSSEKLLQPDIREARKTPRIISAIPISSAPGAGAVVPAPDVTAPALDPASDVDRQVAATVPPPAAPVPVQAPSETDETASLAPAAPTSGLAPVPAAVPPASAPVAPASSKTAAPVPPAPWLGLKSPHAAVAAPAASTLGLGLPVPAASVPPAGPPLPASSEPTETAVAAPAAPVPALRPPVLTAASVPPPASAPVPVPAPSEPTDPAVSSAALMPVVGPPVLTAASVPPPLAPLAAPSSTEPSETAAVTPAALKGEAPVQVPTSSEPIETAVDAPAAPEPSPALALSALTAGPASPQSNEAALPASAEPTESAAARNSSQPTKTKAAAAREHGEPSPALAPPALMEATVPPPASAAVPLPTSSEPTETAAAAQAAHTPAVGPSVLTAAASPPPAAAPTPAKPSSDAKKIDLVTVEDGSGETDTSSPPAPAPNTVVIPAPVTLSAAAAPPSGNPDLQEEVAPTPSSGSLMQAGRGTAAESSSGAYAVQLASERSAAEAHASFRALRAKFPNQLGGREPIVRRTDLGTKGVYFRVMVGPFASMEKAAGMCGRLKTAGCNCLVQRN